MPVGLFQPAQNPAPNPAGFAQAASGIFDTMQQIAAAAQRQRVTQQQQQLKDAFEQELKLRKEGYTPYMSTTGQDPSGLKRRDAQPVDPGRVITDAYGRKWVQPEAKGPDAQKTFSDTTSLLEKGARPVDAAGNVDQNTQIPRYRMDAAGNVTDTGMFGIHAPAPEGTTVTPPGSKQGYFVPGEEEKAGLKSRLDASAAAAKPGTPHVDTEHFSSPVVIDPKTGKATAIALPDGVTHNEKPEKTSKYTFSYHTDDHGNVHVLRGDPDTGDVTETKVIKGAGSARQDDIAERAKERKEDRDAAREQRRQDAAQKQIEAFQTQEQAQHAIRERYGSLIAVKDGEQVMDPKTGQLLQMNKARREGYRSIFNAATSKVDELQTRQKAIIKKFGGDTGESTSRGKLTDQAIAQQYLQRAGGDRAKARQLAKADGWEL